MMCLKFSRGICFRSSSPHPYRNVQSGHAEVQTMALRCVLVIGVGHREASIDWLPSCVVRWCASPPLVRRAVWIGSQRLNLTSLLFTGLEGILRADCCVISVLVVICYVHVRAPMLGHRNECCGSCYEVFFALGMNASRFSG